MVEFIESSRPSITALLPIKNGEKWLKRAVQNLNDVLDSNDEVIVIDDHSTDRTKELLLSSTFKSNFHLISNPGEGLVSALNEGVTSARHEWIARFDVDDVYDPRRILHQTTAIDLETVAVFTDYKILSEYGKNLGVIPSPIFPNAVALSLIRSDRTAHPSVIFRKKAAVDVGLYREEDFPAEDLSLWLRLHSIGKLKSVPFQDLHYTLRPSSISATRYHESKAKTRLLVSQFLDSHSVGSRAYLEYSEIIKGYKKMSLSKERILLFLRDFLTPTIFFQLSHRQKVLITLRLFGYLLNPTYIVIIVKMFSFRRVRESIRFP